jgi:hypothetical protein
MDADEIKQRMEEMDAKLRVELARLGFKPDEIERQLDTNVPDEQKQAERQQILERHFVEQVNDPKSGMMDQIINRVIEQAEREHPGIREEMAKAERRARLKKIAIGAAIGAVLVGVGVWYFVLRDRRSECEKIVGPIAELEKLAGGRLDKPRSYDSKYSCHITIDKDHHQAISIDIESVYGWSWHKSYLEGEKFTDKQPLQTDAEEALVFVAGDMTKVSTDQLTADIYSRVGKSADPTGDALGALPPASHVVLLRRGKDAIKISMDHELFTVEKTIAYGKQVATRLRKHD